MRRDPAVVILAVALVLSLAAGAVVSFYFARWAHQESEAARKAEAEAARARVVAEANERAARQALDRANDELVTSAARSLLRPLALHAQPGQPIPPLSEPEIAALWELANVKDERLRLRFLEEALQSPATIRQLRHRAAEALGAVLGRDPNRRAAVERLVLARWDAAETTAEQKLDLASIVAAVDLGPDSTRRAATRFLEAMRQTTDPRELQPLADGLAAVSGRLDADEVAVKNGEAATLLLQALNRTDDAATRLALTRSLAGVCRRDPVGQRLRQAVAAVGTASPWVALPFAAYRPPPPLPAGTLAELLAHPLCVGEARRILQAERSRH